MHVAPVWEEVVGSVMVMTEPLKTRCRTLTAALLLLAIAGGYVLVWMHAEHAHGSALSTEGCVVCSWAKNLATIGVAAPGIATVCPAGRIAAPLPLVSCAFCYRLPVSARSPPGTI